MLKVNVPASVFLVVEIVTTVFQLTEVGLNVAIVLAGKPLTLKVTTPSIHSLVSRLPSMSSWILC